MKKLISLFLSFIIIISSVGSVTALEPEISESSDLAEFTEDFCALLEVDCNEITSNLSVHLSAGNDEGNAENFENGNSDNTSNNVELTNRIIVKSENEVSSLNAVGHVCGYNDLHVLQFENTEDFNNAFEYYSSLSGVEFVQEDLYCEVSAIETEVGTPEDLIYDAVPTQSQSEKFGFNALRQYLADNTVVYDDEIEVAVVDTGVCYDHPFLEGRVEPTGFNSIDSEGTCYDDRGHGTHVAGVIAANTLDNVTIRPYKVLNSLGKGTVTQVYLGIMAAVEDGCDVINLSLTLRGENALLQEAVSAAYEQDIIVVAAAGNDAVNIDNVYYSPACFDEVITVMACSDVRKIPDFTNYGTKCDFAAPGVEIISTYIDNAYRAMSGTSMATPFISAAVTFALLSGCESRDQVVSKLNDNAYYCLGDKSIKYVNAEYLTREKQTTSDPVFSYRKTTFTNSFDLSFTCRDTDAIIYYNTTSMKDGVFEEYTEPIEINYDMTVKAYAVRPGSKESSIVTYSYTKGVMDQSLFTVNSDGVLTGYSGESPDVVVPKAVNGITVNTVGEGAFSESDVRSFAVLPTVTKIDAEAFKNCDSLEYIRALGITSVDDSAFEDCDKLYRVNCTAIQSVGCRSFYSCDSLGIFSFLKVTKIGESAFEDCITLEKIGSNSIQTLAKRAFYNTAVTDAKLDVCVNAEDYAFSECHNLESVTFFRLTELSEGIFSGCSSLSTLDCDLVTEFCSNSLENCDNLLLLSLNSITDLITSDNITYTFSNFPKLSQFTADSLTSISPYCFSGCSELLSVSLASITDVPEYAFNNCFTIENIYLPMVTTLYRGAFYGCESLSELPVEKITMIYPYAFYGTKIKNGNFLSAVNVYKNAFDGSAFEKVIFSSTNMISDLPDKGIASITSNTVTLDAPVNEDITIYGYEDSLAIEYAMSNDINYVILDETTIFLDNGIDKLSKENNSLSVDFIGFTPSYKWYYTSKPYITDGIFTASNEFSVGSSRVNNLNNNVYPYICCVVGSVDNGITKTYYKFFKNEFFILLSDNEDVQFYLLTANKTCFIMIDDKLPTDPSKFFTVNEEAQSYTIEYSQNSENSQILGTDSIIKIINTDGTEFKATVCVTGDLTGDGVCDALDTFYFERVLGGHEEFASNSGARKIANDMYEATDDGSNPSNQDYQVFVNFQLAMN